MRYAICNEMFGDMELSRAAALTASRGFHGLEIAPFTVFNDFSPSDIDLGLKTIQNALRNSGLVFAGFHWLLTKPEGLNVSTNDSALRLRSWDHLRRLLEAAGELGGGNLIFGSPKQRASGGIPKAEATRNFTEGLASVSDCAVRNSSLLLLEALSSHDTDMLNTLAEVEAFLGRVRLPGVSSMFDFHNVGDETEPWEVLLEKHWGVIRHVHLNTMDGGWPTPEHTEFDAAFRFLRRQKYEGWVSLEIFCVPENPDNVLAEVEAFLDRQARM